MVIGMASKKITITIPEEQLDEVRSLVERGRASSISGFVQHAVAVALDDVAGWRDMLDAALEETGGPLSLSELAWADAVLDEDSSGAATRDPNAA